jgi:uncharacterized protein (DUF488 family)
MATIYTIGFTQKSLRRFVGLLQKARVDLLVDIRLRPDSQLSGYAKREDLAFVLDLFGIGYLHQPLLAPTAEILDDYRRTKDWATYAAHFLPLLQERNAEAIVAALFEDHNAPCLLCSEATADQCHRRLVAEYWASHVPGLKIVHL